MSKFELLPQSRNACRRFVVAFFLSCGSYLHPLPQEARADPFKDVSDKLIGEWRNTDQHFTIIISETGDVFTQGAPLAGSVQRSPVGGGNFEFAGKNLKCNYSIAFLSDGTSDWGLVAEADSGSCPKGGRYVRTAKFDDPSSAKSAPDKPPEVVITTNGAKDAVDPAPVELLGITVVYFNKKDDDGIVTDALNSNNIRFSSRPPVVGRPTNVISCTSDASVDAIKKMAHILVGNGVELRGIAPNVHPGLRNRLTLEHLLEYENFKPLTAEAIDRITDCPPRESLPSKVRITNGCTNTALNIDIRYKDPATNRWFFAYRRNVQPDQEVDFRSEAGMARTTGKYYMFARSIDGTRSWKGYSFYPAQGESETQPYRLVEGSRRKLTCSDQL